MELILCAFALGLIIGYSISKTLNKLKTVGYLRVNDDDLDGPYLFMELTTDIYDVIESKYITLEVDVKQRKSHK